MEVMRVFTPNLHPKIEKTEAKGMKEEIAKEQFLFLCKMKKDNGLFIVLYIPCFHII